MNVCHDEGEYYVGVGAEQNNASWQVVTNTAESVVMALDIELRYKLSFWDDLILSAAESSGASVPYSEDMASGQRYRGIRVTNPLADSTV
jgi:predicted nucleic acid-binding protein